MPSYDRNAAMPILMNWFTEVTGLDAQKKFNSQYFGGTYSPEQLIAHGELSLKSVGRVGRADLKRIEYNEANDINERIEIHVEGIKVIRWDIQIWALSQNEDMDAEYYMDLVRNRIDGYKLRMALRPVAMAFQSMTDTVTVEKVEYNRLWSIATAEVFFNAYSSVLDEKIRHVEIIEVSSNISNADPELNFTVDIDVL